MLFRSASDQPVDLYPLLSTSDAKLKFISQFDSIDSLGDGQHALKALEKLQKLVGNYSVGTEQSLFIINAMSK